jgi:hypothetical protein
MLVVLAPDSPLFPGSAFTQTPEAPAGEQSCALLRERPPYRVTKRFERLVSDEEESLTSDSPLAANGYDEF